jgi:hypothetical protein
MGRDDDGERRVDRGDGARRGGVSGFAGRRDIAVFCRVPAWTVG